MARDNILHMERANRAWPALVDRARAGGPTFTYKEIGIIAGCHWRAAGHFLGDIQKFCKQRGFPRLQAQAVNARSKVPGEGYEGPTGREKHRSELARVYAHGWSKVPPFNLAQGKPKPQGKAKR